MKFERENIFVGIEILILLGTFIIIFMGANSLIDNGNKSLCISSVIKASNEVLEDIERLEEHKLLCVTDECVLNFETKISLEIKQLNDFLELNFCELDLDSKEEKQK